MLSDKVKEKFVSLLPLRIYNSSCWTWLGSITKNGYGRFYLEGRGFYAHRVSYELAYGPVPEGLVVDHLCRTRHCCNPDHLEAKTPKANSNAPGSLVGVATAALNKSKTECPYGHPYSGDNLFVRGSQRGCKICRNDASKRSKRVLR